MIRRIAGKEWLQLSRDRRFLVAAGIVYLLLTASLLAGARQQDELDRQVRQAEASARRAWTSQGQKNPHAAAHFGMYVFKPQSPLALFDRGVDTYTGIAVTLEPHRQNQFRHRPADDTQITAAGDLTPALLLQTLLPLLIILVGFPSIAGERESGTLRQLLATGVSPRTLAVGKAAGLGGALLMLLIPAGILALLGLAATAGPEATVAVALEALLLALAYAAYAAVWLSLTLAVSASTRTSRQALAVLLGFWTLSVLILPRLAAGLAAAAIPAPTLNEFERQIQTALDQGIDGHSPASARAAAFQKRILLQYKAESLQDLPVHFTGLLLQEAEEHGNRVFDHAFNQLWDRFQQQERLQLAAGLASPLIPLRQTSQSLSATSFQHFRRFSAAAETYRRQWIRLLNQDLATNAPPASAASDYRRDNSFWSTVPKFQYRSPNPIETIQMAALPLISLLVWLVASFLWCLRATARLEVHE